MGAVLRNKGVAAPFDNFPAGVTFVSTAGLATQGQAAAFGFSWRPGVLA